MTFPIDLVLFAVLSLLELASLLLVFLLRDGLHAVIALAASFSFSALLFLVMEQPLIALIQLFVMVGGIATYLIVGVTSVDAHRSAHTNRVAFAFLAAAFFAATFYVTSGTTFLGAQSNILSDQVIASGLSSSASLLFMASFMLFSIGIGAIVLLRKIR